MAILKLLLQSIGIAIDVKAAVDEQTALHYAARAGYSIVFELL
jgi:hypothetical protein